MCVRWQDVSERARSRHVLRLRRWRGVREVAGCERARSRHVERAPCGSHLAHPVALLVLEHGKAGSVGRTEPQRLCADVGWLTGAHREKPFARSDFDQFL